MDIEKIKEAKLTMEKKIQVATHDAFTEFHALTGLCPQNIHIQLHDVTTIGEREKRYLVGDVRADIFLL